VCFDAGFGVTSEGEHFVYAIGSASDEDGLKVELNVSLTLPAAVPFVGHLYHIPVSVGNSSVVNVSHSVVALGWTGTDTGLEEYSTIIYYSGVDDLLVDGSRSTHVVLGPITNVTSGEMLSDTTYTIRKVLVYDNDGALLTAVLTQMRAS
jgi:hypothetical protein